MDTPLNPLTPSDKDADKDAGEVRIWEHFMSALECLRERRWLEASEILAVSHPGFKPLVAHAIDSPSCGGTKRLLISYFLSAGHQDVFQFLLENNSPLEDSPYAFKFGDTVCPNILHVLAIRNSSHSLALAIEKMGPLGSASLAQTDVDKGNTALHHACMLSYFPAILAILNAAPELFGVKNKAGATPEDLLDSRAITGDILNGPEVARDIQVSLMSWKAGRAARQALRELGEANDTTKLNGRTSIEMYRFQGRQ